MTVAATITMNPFYMHTCICNIYMHADIFVSTDIGLDREINTYIGLHIYTNIGLHTYRYRPKQIQTCIE